ncbi:LysR family transcriptional regulator [Mesorhizobium sp. M1A.F.Ca.IN.022.05.2.1]|uniref:LysR family transcriptional regulator n=1 Tax=unclassified Mesorhizobium TaxID=325217 RepID=UPI000FCC2BF5|nr:MULTISPECIES: LysR family transcriptional regulator [unclassified Mesorhizobium]RUW04866.1 LysR family transcriptional regulator [Mesorhizobium sp. M1A.F.Ca.IN.022.05.2.1]RWF81241.1 MAG: LysR family transcriptional regulator [Mesorhizobium sp.]RWG02169.1 MAG: LysR family transcriptional regulator [Mesorhizobium sp.]RWG92701.1 MAG: LysR family transcriptional regulator [Mesorhizobium sp.]RWH06647.1 MAG: LysR family transcriptional regulator [Mesorhizobium sp.]
MAFDAADIRLLKIFTSIVEAGGLAPAQDELNISLSTISGHLTALEARLRLTLAQRGRAGFRLTPEGQSVYEEARRLFGAIDSFDVRMHALKQKMTGTLHLGITDNTISDPLCPLEKVLAKFADQAPEVTLEVVTRPPSELLRAILVGQIQIAIASFPRTALGLEYIPLYDEVQSFYCGVDHPLFSTSDEEIDVGIVREHKLVSRTYWGQRDLKIFESVEPRARVSDMEAEARLILSGRFLGYLPDHYAKQFVAQGRIRQIRPDLFRYKAVFQAACEPTERKRGLVSFFIKLLKSELNLKA